TRGVPGLDAGGDACRPWPLAAAPGPGPAASGADGGDAAAAPARVAQRGQPVSGPRGRAWPRDPDTPGPGRVAPADRVLAAGGQRVDRRRRGSAGSARGADGVARAAVV